MLREYRGNVRGIHMGYRDYINAAPPLSDCAKCADMLQEGAIEDEAGMASLEGKATSLLNMLKHDIVGGTDER